MQDQSTDKVTPSENIVSLFAARQEAARKAKGEIAEENTEEKAKSTESFTDLMRKNAENDERLRKERNKANSSVLKSYRIKN